MTDSRLDYRSAGVDSVGEADALKALTDRIRSTFTFAGRRGEPGAVALDLGYFANVIEIGGGMGIAVSTDGVGTKLLIAEMLEKYDTVGIDCVAMNVNDVLCVGARPITLLDYIAVERTDARVLGAIGEGLVRGAEEARISIGGGELAQVAEMIRGVRPGSGFDIVGTAVGLVPLDRVIVGAGLADVVHAGASVIEARVRHLASVSIRALVSVRGAECARTIGGARGEVNAQDQLGPRREEASAKRLLKESVHAAGESGYDRLKS